MSEEQKQEEQTGFYGFVEQQKIAVKELGKALGSFFPNSFKEHTTNAGKAFVSSFKMLIDGLKTDYDDEEPEEKDDAGERKVRVNVE